MRQWGRTVRRHEPITKILCNESASRKQGQSQVECARTMTDHRQYAPATVRNRDFILDVLRGVLPMRGVILEIASGSGEHVVHFARNLPSLVFQPSDPEPEALLSISAWVKAAQVTNVRAPIVLDASQSPWPIGSADGIIYIEHGSHLALGRDGRIDSRCGCDTSSRVAPLSLWPPTDEKGSQGPRATKRSIGAFAIAI